MSIFSVQYKTGPPVILLQFSGIGIGRGKRRMMGWKKVDNVIKVGPIFILRYSNFV